MNRKLKLKIVEKFGTQADFAQALGVDDSAISRVIRGRRRLHRKDEERWAGILGCSSEELFQSAPEGTEHA